MAGSQSGSGGFRFLQNSAETSVCGRNLLRCVCVRVGGAERAVKRSSCVLLSGDRSLKGYTLALFLTLHAPETSQRQKHVILPFFLIA